MDTDRLEMAAGDRVNSLLNPRQGVPGPLNQSQLRDCSLFVSLLVSGSCCEKEGKQSVPVFGNYL